MGYILEISVNTRKHKSVNILKKSIEQIAKHCKLYSNYHQIENNELYKRTHYFVSMCFESTKPNILQFIKLIKNIRGIRIELIYNECSKTLLYGSIYYLKFITNTPGTILYNTGKLRRSYSESELDILKSFYINLDN